MDAMRRRPARKLPSVALAVIAVVVLAVVAVVAVLASFFGSRDRLPSRTWMGEVEVSGLTVAEAVSLTHRVLQEPVILRYQTTTVALRPSDIDFTLNDAAASQLLDAVLRGQQGLDRLPAYLGGVTATHRLAAPVQYSDAQLDEFLYQLAGQFNRDASQPQVDAGTLAVTAGRNGLSLDIGEAKDSVLAALASSTRRMVDLPVDVVPAPATGPQALGDLIQARLSAFAGDGRIAGVYLKDLRTGQEYALNGDVAFSAGGWLRLAIALEAYRVTDGPLPAPAQNALTAMLADGSAARADDVLLGIGRGDAMAGVDQVNALLKKAGLASTFIAQPPGSGAPPPAVVTPANSRADVSTDPDPVAQSTPTEIGLLLEMVEQCRAGTGALVLAFAGQFGTDKCAQYQDLVAAQRIGALIKAVAPDATVIGRQSWDDNTHGDAALVRSPGGDYLLTVVLHSAGGLNWADTSSIIQDIARAAYSFFNPGRTPPEAPPLAAPPPR
jgi:hypothetical protein